MKRILDVDSKPDHFINDLSEGEMKVVYEQTPTYRRMMLMDVGGSRVSTVEQSLDLQQLVLKLRVVNEDGWIDLEDAQHKLLLEKISENVAGVVAYAQAQLYTKVKSAEELKQVE